MGKYFVSCKHNTDEYQRFEVPEAVYNYITQLEYYVLNPNKSRLKERYSERFNPNIDKKI